MASIRGGLEAQKTFYHAYGAAMANWAELEYELGLTFVHLTKMPEKLGRAIFFSARSFQGRADMFEACIPHIRDLPAAKSFLLDAIARARAWQTVRNNLAHEMHGLVLRPDRDGPVFAVSPLKGGTLETADLYGASESFYCLARLIAASRGSVRPVREPELCGEALDQLPSDAPKGAKAHSRLAPLVTRILTSRD